MTYFGEISGHADRTLIVATGPSAAELQLPSVIDLRREGVHVIAVNDAGTWLPEFDTWITLDMSSRNRRIAQWRRPDPSYYAAVPADFGTPGAMKEHHRIPGPDRITYIYRWKGLGLSTDRRGVTTGNSTWAALQAAYLIGSRRIAIVGLDGNTPYYAREARRTRLRNWVHLPELFESGRPQLDRAGVEVVVANERSAVNCFPRRTIDTTLRWLVG